MGTSAPFRLLVTALLAACCLAAPSDQPVWRIETADATGGKYSSIKVDAAGNVHAAYVEDARNILKYAFRDSKLKQWFTTDLDSSGGFASLALDSNQRPHISYLDYGAPTLKYCRWNGTAWEKQTVQIRAKNISFYTSIVLPRDLPSISYYEYWGAGEDYLLNFRNVSWNGRYWELRTIDTDPGSGKFNSMALDAAGNVHAAYGNVKSENASLRYARWNGESWRKEVIEGLGVSGYSAFSVAIATGPGNAPHITSTDATNGLVKYASIQNGKWRVEAIDRLAGSAYPDRNSIVVDENGQPYISYYDSGQGMLKLAYRRGGKWVSEIVDPNFAGFTSSLALADGTIWVSYTDDRGALRVASRRLVELTEPPSPAPKGKQ